MWLGEIFLGGGVLTAQNRPPLLRSSKTRILKENKRKLLLEAFERLDSNFICSLVETQ